MGPQTLTADRAGERADAFLARTVPDLTRSAAQRLLEEKYVGIVPGSKLGKGFDKYVRLSYATSDENLEEALKRMAELAAAL